jgi:hypothetical protein
MKITVRVLSVIIFSFLLFSSCNKGVKIEIDDIDIGQFCDTTIFRGIKPNMYFHDLCAVVGEPNEYIEIKSTDEIDHNPIYYFKEAKVMCYWSGSKRDKIGSIVYTPYQNTHLQVKNVIKWPLKDYDINSATQKIHVYKNDTLFFIMHLENMEIKDISYLLIRK